MSGKLLGRQYYLFDALGSTVNLTKPDGSVQARYQYDAWGNFRAQQGSTWNDFTFTGHEKDTETGLYYFKARYYDPDTARFISQDPYLGETGTPPSLHRYLYAYSNPTVYIDLTGYAAQDFDDLGTQLYSEGHHFAAFGVAAAYSFYSVTDGISLGTLEDSSVELQKDQNLGDAAKGFGHKQVDKVVEYIEEIAVAGAIAGTAQMGVDAVCTRAKVACNAIGDLANKAGDRLNILQENESGTATRKWKAKQVDIEGHDTRKVYQRDDLFEYNEKNIKLMESGNAPIGRDNKPINLHHTTQTETNRIAGTKGVLAEVGQTFHQQNTGKLHMPNKTGKKINQRSFRDDRFKDTEEYRDRTKKYVSVDAKYSKY